MGRWLAAPGPKGDLPRGGPAQDWRYCRLAKKGPETKSFSAIASALAF